ncbi:chromogranin-A isoform X2 [Pseudophryne corroboree]|uniref:chromogranin-A isoform X2 n=1 Tax=Pseudophryne corroboree TaxID=495146 RepID=UPI0030820304
MIYIGVLALALCAAQVFSLPVSSLGSEDDTKVMKCVVEVISGTLSKPNPVPVSQDCLETLRGDERIISILRHQNLLKELQDLAAQGAMERLQKQKKNGGFGGELSGILEKQNNKAQLSEKSDVSALHGKSAESEGGKRQPEEEDERRVSSEHTREGDSEEELESNEISKREDSSEDEEIDNRITDEINDMEPPKDNQEDTSGGRTSDEKEMISKKEPEASQIDDTSDPGKENLTQEGNETDNEEDDTQREDNSMRIPEDFNKETTETESSKESKQDSDKTDCKEDVPNSDEDTSSKDLEDSKRWNKMDELAKELRAKKCAASGNSEEDPDHSMKIPPKDKKYNPSSQESTDAQQWPQRLREDNSESESHISKRPEERKEEASAIRKTEVGVITSQRSK